DRDRRGPRPRRGAPAPVVAGQRLRLQRGHGRDRQGRRGGRRRGVGGARGGHRAGGVEPARSPAARGRAVVGGGPGGAGGAAHRGLHRPLPHHRRDHAVRQLRSGRHGRGHRPAGRHRLGGAAGRPAAAGARRGRGAGAGSGGMTALLDRRLVILSGKGGVGRTTVAAALARAAAESGKRVLIAQTEAAPRLGKLFGLGEPVGTEVRQVAPRIDAVNMTPKSALHEYGLMVLRYETVYRALFENRAVRGFLGAIPGLDAYAMLGKVWWHTTERAGGRPRYDLVILDGPASGHALVMLRLPHAILAAMP